MTGSSSAVPDSFVELTSYDHLSSPCDVSRSSIIKSAAVKDGGMATIEIIDGEKKKPTIHVHKQGDRIENIEFICSCGKSVRLDFESEDE